MKSLNRAKLGFVCLVLAGCTTVYQGGSPVRQADNTGPQVAGDTCLHYGSDSYQCNPTFDSTMLQLTGPCPTFCGVNRQWWTSNPVRPLAGGNTLGLSAKYSASNSGNGDWHGYLCAQLTDTTTLQSILWCGETWRSDGPPGPANTVWDDTIQGGLGNEPNGGFDQWVPSPSAAWALTGTQLQNMISQVDKWLPATLTSYGRVEVFQKYSLNPSDYALVSLQCGVEGDGATAGSTVNASCDNLQAGYGH